jgi:hypothetical protein
MRAMMKMIPIGCGLLIAAAFGARAADSQTVPTEGVACDGRAANIVAGDGDRVAYGTSGDDFVVLPVGVPYYSGGGSDVVCNEQGEVEAVIVPDSTGPAERPTTPAKLPDLTTEEEQLSGAMWDGAS